MTRVFRVESIRETHAVAARLARPLARALGLGSKGGSVTIGLIGELGSGKTTFVQGFVAAMRNGRRVKVTSPSFALVHRYPTNPPVHHLDLYRLAGREALDEIGYFGDAFTEGLTLVEWIDLVPEAAPSDWIEIRLAVTATGGREIRFCAHGEAAMALLSEVES